MRPEEDDEFLEGRRDTMTLQRIEPEEAKRLLDEGEHVYLDVRSSGEFESGHVPGAINIPLLERSPAGPGMIENPDFLDQVEARFGKDDRIIVGCLRGGRSMKAAQLLIATGFTNVVDMRGGYDGEVDQAGNVTYPGWARRGLPTTTE